MTTERLVSPPRPGVRVTAVGLGQAAPDGRRILDDISLTVEPGELVAVIGASGAGKTTLLETLAGVRGPAAGTVSHDGVAPAGVVGFVPQDDIIHRELPLRRTLRHAARLRLPSATPPVEVARRVDEVLGELGLTERHGVPVVRLSGGERKRASIAVELLTRPGVLFLDEPTSGLDPAIAVDLLRALRSLADGGATVVLTTHQITDVDRCDRVVVLTRDGRLAFVGAPAAARDFFGVRTLAEVYLRLDAEEDPATWPDRFTARDGGTRSRRRAVAAPDRPALGHPARCDSGRCSPPATPRSSPATGSPWRSCSARR
ncbi:ABC transporter ATP-binding protein [Micromonospora krabiensis]|uniref:ABC-type multidrug transport system, ATPase component n=1 Tax=Micromonospora krabiensis TaxID=307121 RepID=A0A1C3MYR4_9ACTN|nr:ABC transporter ATP-binding protein [Micromonospora krabiensis]SBV25486.1 ABC-type multidrug transport system, ATPase component [Micromonospora krabiensis]